MFKKVNVKIDGGFELDLPEMVKVRQVFPAPELEDIEFTVAAQINKEEIKQLVKPGARIAIAVGSRGIANLDVIVGALVANLKQLDAKPIIVPGMGSHGGATAEGQRGVLANYNITEETMGVPVKSSMEVVQIAELDDGYPVYLDKTAFECDAIIPVNRVKPHTDFKGPHESGLLKMLAIGLGKHKGATKVHTQGFNQFAHLIPALGQTIIRNAPVIFGLAILENAYDHTAEVIAIKADKIYDQEKELNSRAKNLLPKFLMSEIDVLIVNEMGKDISGSGMDPNIIGRNVSGEPGFAAPPIKKIVVLGLTEKTHGNVTGFGLADVTTLLVVNQIDFSATYANAITSTELDGGKIPMFFNNDKEAIAVAVKTCNRVEPRGAKIVRINSTLEMSEIEVSTALIPELEKRDDIEVLSAPYPLKYDASGVLL